MSPACPGFLEVEGVLRLEENVLGQLRYQPHEDLAAVPGSWKLRHRAQVCREYAIANNGLHTLQVTIHDKGRVEGVPVRPLNVPTAPLEVPVLAANPLAGNPEAVIATDSRLAGHVDRSREEILTARAIPKDRARAGVPIACRGLSGDDIADRQGLLQELERGVVELIVVVKSKSLHFPQPRKVPPVAQPES